MCAGANNADVTSNNIEPLNTALPININEGIIDKANALNTESFQKNIIQITQ